MYGMQVARQGFLSVRAQYPFPGNPERSPIRVTQICRKNWSGRRDSNSRPQPWQGCALPLSYARILIRVFTALPPRGVIKRISPGFARRKFCETAQFPTSGTLTCEYLSAQHRTDLIGPHFPALDIHESRPDGTLRTGPGEADRRCFPLPQPGIPPLRQTYQNRPQRQADG